MLGNGSLGNVMLGNGSLGNVMLGNGSLGNVMLGNGSLGNVMLGNGSLGNVMLGNDSLGNGSLGNAKENKRGKEDINNRFFPSLRLHIKERKSLKQILSLSSFGRPSPLFLTEIQKKIARLSGKRKRLQNKGS